MAQSWPAAGNPNLGINTSPDNDKKNSLPIDTPDDRGVTQGNRYGVMTPTMSPDTPNGGPNRGSNAFLESSGADRVFLWVDNFQAAFNISGTQAQSVTTRSFYPHNLGQLTLTVHGQTPNQYEYGRVVEFIRHSHKKAVASGESFRLVIPEITPGEDSKLRNPEDSRNTRSPVDVGGYVLSIERRNERFVNAPEYEFQFVILQSRNFLGMMDEPVIQKNLVTILQLVENDKEFKWEEPKAVYTPISDDIPSFPGL